MRNLVLEFIQFSIPFEVDQIHICLVAWGYEFNEENLNSFTSMFEELTSSESQSNLSFS